MAFLLHFKDDGTKNNKIMHVFFLGIIFYQISCIILSYIHFTFPQTSKCVLSNGIKNMHILASGPELQQLYLGMSFWVKMGKKKSPILKLTYLVGIITWLI